MSLFVRYCCIAHWSLIVCTSLGDLLSGDDGTTTWTIFTCHLFCFSFWWSDLIGRFVVGTVLSFQIFFPTLNSLFVIFFHFQERKKAQQTCQLSRCYLESPSFNQFHRFYWIIKSVLTNFTGSIAYRMLQNNLSIGNYFICYLRRFIFLHMKLLILLEVPQTL